MNQPIQNTFQNTGHKFV